MINLDTEVGDHLVDRAMRVYDDEIDHAADLVRQTRQEAAMRAAIETVLRIDRATQIVAMLCELSAEEWAFLKHECPNEISQLRNYLCRF